MVKSTLKEAGEGIQNKLSQPLGSAWDRPENHTLVLNWVIFWNKPQGNGMSPWHWENHCVWCLLEVCLKFIYNALSLSPEILVVLRKLNLEEIRAENPVNFIRIAAISLLLKILILKLLNFSIFNSFFCYFFSLFLFKYIEGMSPFKVFCGAWSSIPCGDWIHIRHPDH